MQWYHSSYLVNLPEQPNAVIVREFGRMLGQTPVSAGVITSAAQVRFIQEACASAAQTNALEAAGTTADTWTGFRVVRWRGCWAVVTRQKLNKRRVWARSENADPLTMGSVTRIISDQGGHYCANHVRAQLDARHVSVDYVSPVTGEVMHTTNYAEYMAAVLDQQRAASDFASARRSPEPPERGNRAQRRARRFGGRR